MNSTPAVEIESTSVLTGEVPPLCAVEPLVSIVIVNTNELHHLRRCLPAIFRQEYANFEVLLVDNVSTDGSREWVADEFSLVRTICNQRNLGYAGANNVGFRHARGELIAVLNPDTEVDPRWLREIVAVLDENPRTRPGDAQGSADGPSR